LIQYRNAGEVLKRIVRGIIRPRPLVKYWEWADKHVNIPPDASGPIPGRLNTGRLPIFRGLFDLAQQSHIHFVTLCASIRVGKTLFSIVLMLYWLAEKAGSIVWLDPSGASAKKVSKAEIDPFILACEPAAKLAVFGRTTWTSLWKTFRGKILRFVGSGEEANLHGFNAELAIINEFDRCKEAVVKSKGNREAKEDSSSADKIIGRTQLFPFTRKIIENSSPGMAGEFSPIWQSFLRGTQHHCYLPCPHCSQAAKEKGKTFPQPEKWPVGWSDESRDPHLTGWQRLSFSHKTAQVPFDEHLLPIDGTREEKTGQISFETAAIWIDAVAQWDATQMTRIKTGYDFDILENSTTYQCAYCEKHIEQQSLRWMLNRYRWVAHNPKAPKDRISAHLWRAYAPPELGGGFAAIAKQFLESKGDVGKLITFHNFTLGLPFIRTGAAVNIGDIDRVMARTPIRYVKGQLPRLPQVLTITADKQKDHLWYLIRAWGILEEHPDKPTWSALVDWGVAMSMEELCVLAGEKPDASGRIRHFTFTDPAVKEHKFTCSAGLIDSGDDADRVYEFCLKRTRIFDPYKGAGPAQTRWNKIRMGKVYDDQLDLWLCWSNHYAARLYYDCVKHGQAGGEAIHWWLPIDADDEYKAQLTDEYQENGEWLSRKSNNHLGDCEKMQLVISELVEARLQTLRDADKGAAKQKTDA
jgi:phage terminase large subunit GpA-like protein